MAAGALLALAAGISAGSLFYELRPCDPAVMIVAASSLAAIALAATWIPGRRAAALDPVGALRDE